MLSPIESNYELGGHLLLLISADRGHLVAIETFTLTGPDKQAELAAGRPLDQVLGLPAATLLSYELANAEGHPARPGEQLVRVTLHYAGLSERRGLALAYEGGGWVISAVE